MAEDKDGKMNCPICAEEISSSAKKCKHCGETLDASMRMSEEALRAAQGKQNVYMNAGGGGASSSSSSAVAGGGTQTQQHLIPFNHTLHIILTVLTAGLWLGVYILLYLFRNKNIYI